MPESIILLGPWQAGKSTVGHLLAETLQMPYCDLPSKAADYWRPAGYDPETFRRVHLEEGIEAVLRYLGPIEVETLERGLRDYPRSIIEVGPTQAVQEQSELAHRVQNALKAFRNVFLLLPTREISDSEQILHERGAMDRIDGLDEFTYFLGHPSNFNLARHIIYTKGKTPQQSCDEILACCTPGASIILIGAPYTGKSTLGRLLAERLGMQNVSMDRKRWDYYKEIGWNSEEQDRIGAAEGFAGIYRYWKRFDLYAIGRLLEEYANCVIDFGAGHSVYEDDAQLARAIELLTPYPNVVLLLPAPDLEESVAILQERSGFSRNGMPANRFFMLHMKKIEAVTHVIYTAGKTPEETRDEILGLCH